MTRYPKTIREGAAKVRIYKSKSARHKSGHRFAVVWMDGETRRQRDFADPKDAEAFARVTAGNLHAGRVDGINVDDIDTLTTAKSIAGETGVVQALREWQRANELTHGHLLEVCKQWARDHAGEFRRVPLDEAIRLFKSARAKDGVNVRKTYRNRLERLSEAMPGMDVATISTPALTAYLNAIPHPVTRATERKTIVTFFRWCRDQGYVTESTRTAACRTTRPRNGDEGEVTIITPSVGRDVLRLIATRHPDLLAATVLALFAAIRREEIEAQTWADIDLAERTLVVTKAKPRTPSNRIVELPEAAVEWMLRCGERTGLVCPHDGMRKVRNACAEAGIRLPKNVFRHSAISYRLACGYTKGQVALWAGHSEAVLTSRYTRTRKKPEGEAWFGLTPGRVLGGQENVVEMEG